MKNIEFEKGLTKETVVEISKIKNEPNWMRKFRIDAYDKFKSLKMPSFGPKIEIDFDDITYYKSTDNKVHKSWKKIDKKANDIAENLGLKKAEKEYLDGIGYQFESEVIYHNMIKELEEKKVIFCDTDSALRKHPEIFKKYFNTLVSYDENKFTALNSAVWSGGTFIYIPPHTHLERPLQSYFRINTKDMGQFERTLIIVDDDSSLHYIEGCTAPTYSSDSLHAAVVEIFVGKNSSCRYTTVQNWSNDVYNLVTKRALVEENGSMEWIDGNLGSKINMKYPACILKGNNSKGTCISIAMADKGMIQDTGAKMIHIGKNTKSNIIAKSIAKNGGNSSYRGTVKISKNATNSKSKVKCDTLLVDAFSKSDTIPTNICSNKSSTIEHEATVSKISEENLFYLMSRGIDKEKAIELSLNGFIEIFREELPLEYAVELNNLMKNNFKPICMK